MVLVMGVMGVMEAMMYICLEVWGMGNKYGVEVGVGAGKF